MLNLRRGIDIDFDTYERLIKTEGTRLYVDKGEYKGKVDYLNAQARSLQKMTAEKLGAASNGKNARATREPLLDTLVEHLGVDPFYLKAHQNSPNLSTDKNVLAQFVKKLESWAKDVENGSPDDCEYQDLNGKKMTYVNQLVYDILESYREFKELQSAASYKKKLDSMDKTDVISNDGLALDTIGFEYEQATTRRYYTKNDSVQNWHKSLCSSIVAPKGYTMWWGDLPQIDLRMFLFGILMPADPHLGEIAKTSDDLYEVFTRYMFSSVGRVFNIDEFKKNRKKYKTGILASLYGMGTASLTKKLDDADVAKMFATFFAKNSAYGEFLKRVDGVFKLGEGVYIKDYFDVEAAVQYYGNGTNTTQLHNQALSTPNQCGSNSVIVAWVTNVLKEFEKYGLKTRISFDPDPEYDMFGPVILDLPGEGLTGVNACQVAKGIAEKAEAETPKLGIAEAFKKKQEEIRLKDMNKVDVEVMLIRHDEVVLLLSDKAMEYQWILASASTIQIDDWIPIRMSVGLGTRYSVEDPGLMEAYEQQAKDKAAEGYIIQPKIEKRLGKFEPLKKTITAVTFSNYNAVDFLVNVIGVVEEEAKTLSEEEALKWLEAKYLKLKPSSINDAQDFLKWYGKCNYWNPETEQWVYQRPIAELKRFDVAGIICYNMTGTSYNIDFEGPLFKYSRDGLEATRLSLDNLVPWSSEQEADVDKYHKTSYGFTNGSGSIQSKRGKRGGSGFEIHKKSSGIAKNGTNINIEPDYGEIDKYDLFGNNGIDADYQVGEKAVKSPFNADDLPW